MSTRAASVAHGNPLDLATDEIIVPGAPPVPQGCELQEQPRGPHALAAPSRPRRREGVFDRDDHKGRIGMKVAAQWIQIVFGALLFTATLFAIVALPGLVSESASSAPVTSDLGNRDQRWHERMPDSEQPRPW